VDFSRAAGSLAWPWMAVIAAIFPTAVSGQTGNVTDAPRVIACGGPTPVARIPVELLGQYGGTRQTQGSLAAGLSWLARQQAADGSWSFDKLKQPEGAPENESGNPGTWDSKIGATGLALLPFLAAGQTHQSRGPYQRNVSNGLKFLLSHTTLPAQGGDWRDNDDLVWQAVATLALCEGYRATFDPAIGREAQAALDHIVSTRDKNSGGWAWKQGEKASTTASAWPLLAIRSGLRSYLRVAPDVWDEAGKFLADMQIKQSAEFGDTSHRDATDMATAVGQFSRLPLAFSEPRKEDPAWRQGAEYLCERGPSGTDVAFNLFATLNLCQCLDPKWDAWNRRLRRQLIESQATTGWDAGSWFHAEDVHADDGGRLYQTALSTLTLTVYRRGLAIYGMTRAPKVPSTLIIDDVGQRSSQFNFRVKPTDPWMSMPPIPLPLDLLQPEFPNTGMR
jgi:hypothetical protein